MKIFNNKLTFDKLAGMVSYYRTCRSKRIHNGNKRYGTYYYCNNLNKNDLSKYDNVIFLTGHSEFAPEQKKEIIFIFD